MRRTVLVVVCLGLLAAVGTVFTRVVAARVPEQRATLERLIAERTGLEVRFDNVHFSWGLDGTSAVFERVELLDPVRNRVRVVAPELRVEFDTWDFLRHQQFSLGHVTLSSPDIEIVGESEHTPADTKFSRKAPTVSRAALREQDEAALVRRFTQWAALMPIGRIEVEGARVHLLRPGDRAPLHSFTLSQADITRGAHSLNAFGTMLLSQDVGQSLFVSVKLNGLGAPEGASGDLRLIARRVLLDKLGFDVVRGRGTLDAKLAIRQGLVLSAQWQVSARELEFPSGKKFDHFTVNASLRRAQNDVLLEFTDLQVTRGSKLELSPRLTARVQFAPGSLRLDRVTAQSDRIPFMAAELLADMLAPQIEPHLANLPDGWSANAGELRGLRFDSKGASFSAQVSGVTLVRAADGARVADLSAALSMEDGSVQMDFDAAHAAKLWMPGAEQPRPLHLEGTLGLRRAPQLPQLAFSKFKVSDGGGSLRADGPWDGERNARPLTLEISNIDRALLGDAWNLLDLGDEVPRLADISAGQIVTGKLQLLPVSEQESRHVDWQRSRGSLTLSGLSSAGEGVPRLASAGGKLDFSRTGVQLQLTSGLIDDLQLSTARIEWPRRGAPRFQASLRGDLQSTLLQQLLREQGLDKLGGAVTLDADARGEAALADPKLWRVTARVEGGSIPLASDLPPAKDLSGTVRYANGQLRGLSLEGTWLDGPLKIETRRASNAGALQANISGVADAAPLLKLLGQADAAELVNGQLAWNGTMQRIESDAPEGDSWQLSLNSNLAGVESRLPEPFDKSRARQLNVQAELRIDARGVREFDIESGRDSIRGRVKDGATLASFEVQGVAGELTGSAESGAESRLAIDRLEVRRAPLVLAAAGALLPQDADLVIHVAELRHANRAMSALRAELGRRESGLEFTLDSAEGAPHELNASGACSTQAHCRMEFAFDTAQLASLLDVNQLPAAWPTRALKASGELSWRSDVADENLAALTGQFDIEALGSDNTHQLVASATLSDGQIDLANVQGSGPQSDQVFRGNGRIGLLARTYELTVDYERVSLAASAVPTPARAGLARAWSVLRGSAARRGWAEPEPPQRVQWQGTWD